MFYNQPNQLLFDSVVYIILVCFGVYGFYNRYFIKTTNYNITTSKNIHLKIAFVSDFHIGDKVINKTILKKAVEKINSKNVDIVILGGDILEQYSDIFTQSTLNEEIKNLHSKYGTYAVLGNHEYYGGEPYQITETLTKNGNVIVLNDEYKDFDNFVLIGREDKTKSYFGTKRKKIEEILNVDKNIFNIVIDHNPADFNQSVKNDIDLQLSGHTHNGQFFPFNLIVRFFYKKPYGLLKENNSSLIISSGLAGWRIPIKLFSKPEIVFIEINKI